MHLVGIFLALVAPQRLNFRRRMFMKRWHIRDIILVTIIAIFMGVIFWAIGPVYTILAAALAPFGLQPLANELLLGIWVMAGPLAGFVIRIPGAATLGELLGAVVEMFLGGIWGASTLISGVLLSLIHI